MSEDFKFQPCISDVYPASSKFGKDLREAIDSLQDCSPMISIDPERLADALDEYLGETEHNGAEGFREGITVQDIAEVLYDVFLYLINSGEAVG